MHVLRLALFAALTLAIPACTHLDENPHRVSRMSDLKDCEMIGDGMAEAGQDWVAYRCVGVSGVPVWLTYADSARSYLGFGRHENTSGPFGLDRDDDWPVEWRGIMRGADFEPRRVIVRMRRPAVGLPTDGEGLCFVYHLSRDGRSCLIGQDLRSENEARRAADADDPNPECASLPNVPTMPH